MERIPIKFKRVAAAFDEAVRWQRPCGGGGGSGSSGSEYWPESRTDLSDLVNSWHDDHDQVEGHDHQFDLDKIEEEVADELEDEEEDEDNGNNNDNKCEGRIYEERDTEKEEMLQRLLLECGGGGGGGGGGKKNDVKKSTIYEEIEVALKLIGGDCSSSYSTRNVIKRNLMAHLRAKGFDAGLCKSRWEKTGRFPAGTYEYVDVNMGQQARYIVEIFLPGELEIARPTARYTALLSMIPSILIIKKPHVLKQIMRLMSAAMRESLKHVGMHVPPWRRNGYMQAKYLSPYKRTTNREPAGGGTRVASDGIGEKDGSAQKWSSSINVGFEAGLTSRVDVPYYYCRADDFVTRKSGGVRVGLLSAILQAGK